MMDTSNWINLGILVVTAFVGILSWLGARNSAKKASSQQEKANDAANRSAKAAQELASIQHNQLAIEKVRQEDAAIAATKAKVSAKLITGKHSSVLQLANRGQATATNLQIQVKSATQILPFSLDDERNYFSVDKKPKELTLPSGGTYEYKPNFSGTAGFNPPLDVKIEWDDGSGQRGDWEGTLT